MSNMRFFVSIRRLAGPHGRGKRGVGGGWCRCRCRVCRDRIVLYVCNVTPDAPVHDNDVGGAVCDVRELVSVGVKKAVRRKRIRGGWLDAMQRRG